MKKQITALALLTYAALVVDAAAQLEPRRGYAGGNFMLDLQGADAGWIRSVEGGAVTAEVIEDYQAGYTATKHLGQLRYEDFKIQFGPAIPSPALLNWISETWRLNLSPRNGSITTADFRMEAISQREFTNAVITETTFPACDGASKEPGFIGLKFAPEYTRFTKASGKPVRGFNPTPQQRWLPSNFRLIIDGLDCTRIVRIDSFTVKNSYTSNEVGNARDYMKEPGKIDFPNLKITLNTASLKSWQDWFESFVVQGKNGTGDEKKGTLEFLSPNGRQVLLSIKLEGLGIFRLEDAENAANSDAIVRTSAELYCEKMTLVPGGAK